MRQLVIIGARAMAREAYIYAKGTCPIAEDIASRVLTLPTYYGLAPDDARDIARNVLEIVGAV